MNAAVSELSRPARADEITRTPPLIALRPREESGLVPMLTSVIWIGCVLIGIAGFVLPYLRPQPLVKVPPPVTAELLNVELSSDPLPPANPAPPPPNLLPPPVARPLATPPPPQMISVAAPSPQIAFAIPIAAPATVVPVKEAAYRTVETPTAETPAVAIPPAPTPLIFGQGEGKQPAPEYPRESLRQGQEGTVTVRMTVGEDGRVFAAEASQPSAWPLLDSAALRVVKSRWRFTPGPLRAYEVAIRFQLSK
ncbi:MAG TPA: energy transducer TonB [Verrucomicrobiae bacterium]|jgi:protein TonB